MSDSSFTITGRTNKTFDYVMDAVHVQGCGFAHSPNAADLHVLVSLDVRNDDGDTANVAIFLAPDQADILAQLLRTLMEKPVAPPMGGH